MTKKHDNDYWTIPSDYSQLDHIVAHHLGIEEAIVLRLLYSMCRYKKQQYGSSWFQGSWTFWQSKVKFMSAKKLQRVFDVLVEKSLIEKRIDYKEGNWYRVNQPQIEAMLIEARDKYFDKNFPILTAEDPDPGQNDQASLDKMTKQPSQNDQALLTVSPISPLSSPNDCAVTESTSRKSPPKAKVTGGVEVWEAYALAYEKRYACQPLRNLKVNSICKKLHDMLGQEAPALVQHYVGMNKRWYVERSHSLECFMSDVQAVRTSYLTGRTMTSTRAAEIDKEQSFRETIYGIERQGAAEFDIFEGVERPNTDYLASPKVLRERALAAARDTVDTSASPVCEEVPLAKPRGNS